MAQTTDKIMEALSAVALPDGGDLATRGMVRALRIEGGQISFVIEADSPEQAASLEPQRRAAQAAVSELDGVETVSVVLTAHASAPPEPEIPRLKAKAPPPPQEGPRHIPGVKRVIAIASGKGGVGKSTLASNLAVALARQGRRVGLLDADILGPSQVQMMGAARRPVSKDGKTMTPVTAHGVKMMSIGLMVRPETAVVWRGPMLLGALEQLLFKVDWGALDLLLIDLPPGTGDVQITLSQKVKMTGALIVSTPQDVALLDAVRALDMFQKVRIPVLGLVENMSVYICPECGHEDHVFGHGGVREEAARRGLPFLGEIPLARDVRLAGDGGLPVAAGEGKVAEAYARLAADLVEGGLA